MQMNQRLAILTLIIATCFARSVIAQTQVARPVLQPDSNGDFFRNTAPISGQVAGRQLASGSLWQVVSPGLNCRSSAGIEYEIVRQFSQGEILQADVGRGGADEVQENARDDRGKPWMRTRSEQGESYNCYVRANSRYITPATGVSNRSLSIWQNLKLPSLEMP